MKKIKENTIPRAIKDFTAWQVSRRRFIRNSLVIGALAQMTILQSCIDNETIADTVLNKKQLNIAIAVQNILFPRDDIGPGAIDFSAEKFLLWVLSDKRIDPSENQYIIDGLQWLNETSVEELDMDFLKLSKTKQVKLIQLVSQKSWGESWLSTMLTIIFEAMISDPIYGFNKDGIGWKWLEHQVGYPRPTKELMYDNIFRSIGY